MLSYAITTLQYYKGELGLSICGKKGEKPFFKGLFILTLLLPKVLDN
jgi:hypothetical protein